MTLTKNSLLALVLSSFCCVAGCGGGGVTSSTVPTNSGPPSNPVPSISTLTPANLVAESGDSVLDVIGTGFSSSTILLWNSTTLTPTLVSTTELKVTIPAADLTGSSQNQIAAKNPPPGGGTSSAVTFNVNSPVPAITSISPQSVPSGTAATITINGTGFESNSVALWDGSARPTTVISPTELQVVLTATDLQNPSTGSLSVSNPGPGAITSPTSPLTVAAPAPVIQSVSIAPAFGLAGNCLQLQVTITGKNFEFDSGIQANGIALANSSTGSTTRLVGELPIGFVSQAGALSFTVTNPDQGPSVSSPFAYPSTNPPLLSACASPSPTTVFVGTNFSFIVQPSEVNVSGNVTITLGTLPTGITTANTSVPLPPTGISFHLQAANSAIAGTYDLPLTVTSGSSTGQGDFDFTVSTSAVPSFSFSTPLNNEMGVPIGGSGSLQFQTSVNSSNNTDFDITPSVTGLPSGTTAAFSPSVFLPGQSVTVTLTAANNAPITQNASVLLTGTPSASVPNATANFFVDVTQPPGSLPGSRTDFVPTAGTPVAAAYDATHNLIFSSNPDWNRVDVISNATHKIIKSIPIRSPRGLDITQDNSHVWVQTASPNIYSIDTTSLQANHYTFSAITSTGFATSFSNDRLLALSDGTLYIFFSDGGALQSAIWNPQTNQTTVLSLTGIPIRSGDGTHVYSPAATGVAVYKVSGQTVSMLGSGLTAPQVVAANQDGSEIVLGNSAGIGLYDQNLTLLGSLPGDLIDPVGMLFSHDDTKLYGIGPYQGVNAILTIDTSSLTVSAIAPATSIAPFMTSGAARNATPFAVDSSGMILGLQNYGIAFEDSTFTQNFAVNQPPFNGATQFLTVFAGPLAGGTASSVNFLAGLTPDVWFGQTRGVVNITQDQVTFISPPASVPGPVNLKFIYPDGQQQFSPQIFTYSTVPRYAVTSGSGPDGGGAAQIVGYGMPLDASGGTVMVGPNTATITTLPSPNPTYSAEPFPSTILSYTLPPGTPGWADLQVSSPIGVGTLPKSVFYAKSITDYASADSFTAILFDGPRKQLYISAGDHVDVFSTASNQFITALHPAAQGSQKQFTGLALTPDGSQLLVADLADGSLAVINPDTPSSTFAIPIASTPGGGGNCATGPLYVAATSNNLAFVTTGGLPALSCGQAGGVYLVSLQTHGVTQPAQCINGSSADATTDGNFVAIGEGTCVYAVQTATYTKVEFPDTDRGIAVSADGNVLASSDVISDLSLNMLGSIAHPIGLYGSKTNPPLVLLHPRLNASGSLYYMSYPNYFEIIDVAHATLLMRFALTETVQNVIASLAIDSGGRFVYLLTDKGLTVVDLGAAPLSIGHLSQQNASPGTQVVVRGSGFDSGTTATVGGFSAAVTFTDENTLTLTIPAAASGPQNIVLTRSDGESYTLESGVVLP